MKKQVHRGDEFDVASRCIALEKILLSNLEVGNSKIYSKDKTVKLDLRSIDYLIKRVAERPEIYSGVVIAVETEMKTVTERNFLFQKKTHEREVCTRLVITKNEVKVRESTKTPRGKDIASENETS
jgi:hypothetical protein